MGYKYDTIRVGSIRHWFVFYENWFENKFPRSIFFSFNFKQVNRQLFELLMFRIEKCPLFGFLELIYFFLY